MMGTAKTARRKHEWMNTKLLQARQSETELDEEELIGNFCISLIATRKTAIELLQNFESAGIIKRVEGKITHG